MLTVFANEHDDVLAHCAVGDFVLGFTPLAHEHDILSHSAVGAFLLELPPLTHKHVQVLREST